MLVVTTTTTISTFRPLFQTKHVKDKIFVAVNACFEWQAQNKLLHDQEMSSQTKRERTKAIAKATAIYAQEKQVLPCDKDVIFQKRTLAVRIAEARRAPHRLISWTLATWDIVRTSVVDANNARRRGAQDIRKFFDKKENVQLADHQRIYTALTRRPQNELKKARNETGSTPPGIFRQHQPPTPAGEKSNAETRQSDFPTRVDSTKPGRDNFCGWENRDDIIFAANLRRGEFTEL